MADTIHLEIVTAAEPAIKASIRQLYLPAYLGKAGILEDHKPYITLIKPGEISYRDIHDKNHYLYIQEGFMEVIDNKVVIISDAVERGETFNKEEIEKKLSIPSIFQEALSLTNLVFQIIVKHLLMKTDIMNLQLRLSCILFLAS